MTHTDTQRKAKPKEKQEVREKKMNVLTYETERSEI